jgi:hypothetical protein
MLGLATGILLLVQSPQASVRGVVRDAESGVPLSGAVVVLSDLDRSVVTDSAGSYRFTDVPPGPQHLAVRRIGYAARTLHAFVPEQGTLRIDISLEAAPMRLSPLVVHNVPAIRGLESDSTSYPDRGVSLAAIRNDPFLAEPDGFLALSGGDLTTNPESPEGLHVRGAPSDQTGYVLDGVPIFSPFHSAGVFSAWNPDALERVQLSSTSPSPVYPAALSGTVEGVTRAPGSILVAQGSMSTTQARVALDGPLGKAGAGFLLSLRTGYPGWIAPRHDGSYLGGGTEDVLGKLDSPLLRGSLRLLFYQTGNSIGSSAQVESDSTPKNAFEWSSNSLGIQWVRQAGPTTFRIQGWSAGSEAEATWLGPTPIRLSSDRADVGLLLMGEQRQHGRSTGFGIRLERSRTTYQPSAIESEAPAPLINLDVSTPVATAFVQHQRTLARGFEAEAGASASAAAGSVYVNLATQLRVRLADALMLSASYVRAHQFAQSLRNSESVVGNIFPVELYVGVGSHAVPVARNDRAILGLDYRPRPGLRLAAQGFLSRSTGLLLVAPTTGDPFALDRFTTGWGTTPGITLDAGLRGSRYGLIASYGWQRVQLQYADSSYRPTYGASHGFQLGGILFPTSRSAVRVALTGAFGRQGTDISNMEWEACNLVDRGCEFGGSPQTIGSLGGTHLPGYLRLDLGVRQHWHLSLAGRDVVLALYGTLSNVLGRGNILTIATDPATGRRSAVEMRPRAPLVVGLDWRF